MTNAEKALQYFIIAVPEDKEQAEAYFWARRALNVAVRSYKETYDLLRVIENQELIARAEAAEARAEKAERERDAAISDMEALMWYSGDGCNICAHSVEVHRVPYVRLTCDLKGKSVDCDPKWRGRKEE